MNFSFKRVAVTGATGTLGISFIRQCLAAGIQVLAFVHPGSANIARLGKHENLEVIPCGLEDMENFDPEGRQAEVFLHLAWGHTNRAVRNQMKPQIDNIRWSVDSVQLAHRLGCRVYIGAGSQAEYGRKSYAISETELPCPEGAYGMAKLCAGQMTRTLCKELGIRHIWPRIFSTYGPYTQDSSILNYAIRMLLSGRAPELTKCEQIWDFIYVDDAARALMLLADKGRDGEIYNIASGDAAPLRSYLMTVCSAVQNGITPAFGAVPYSADTVMHLKGDISKIRSEIGFVPEISFEEGCRKTIAWAENYYQS